MASNTNKITWILLLAVIILFLAVGLLLFSYYSTVSITTDTEKTNINESSEENDTVCNIIETREYKIICDRDNETILGECEAFDHEYYLEVKTCEYNEAIKNAVIDCRLTNTEVGGGVFSVEYGFLINKEDENESIISKKHWIAGGETAVFYRDIDMDKDEFVDCVCKIVPPKFVVCGPKTYFIEQNCMLSALIKKRTVCE